MTQEDKELLLQDLCARLPYGVKILHEGWDYEWDDEMSTRERVVGIDEYFIYTKVIDTHSGEEYRDDKHPIDTFDDKLYLRPLLSMTEEERTEVEDLNMNPFSGSVTDWLNKNKFDYRDLIPMGLALEAPEDMYQVN